MPTRITESTGTVGSGTASMLRAKRVHSSRPKTIPTGIPTMMPATAVTVDCHATTRLSCRGVKPSAFKRARSRRRWRTEATSVERERDDRPESEPSSKDDRGRADGLVVHDLGGTLHAEDCDGVAGGFGIAVGGEGVVRDRGDPLEVRPTLNGAHRAAQPHEDHLRAVEGRVRIEEGASER